MRRIATALAVAAALTLGGCITTGSYGSSIFQGISNVFSVISGATVTPQAVIIAGNSVDALQDTATVYLRLPLCRPGSTPVCRVKEATGPIRRTVFAMREARDDLKKFQRAHPESAPPASLYEKVTAAATALNKVLVQFRAEPIIATIAK